MVAGSQIQRLFVLLHAAPHCGGGRCAANPPLWAESEMQQPILGLYTAPPRLELVVWACLGPPWPSLPAEPCDPPSVGHFSLASKGTERGPHRPACGMR